MQRVPVITGTVQAVNGYLCDVLPSDGGAVLFDVRLKVASNDGEDGCYSIPHIGSQVRLVMLGGNSNAWAVTDVERIERWVLHLPGGATIEAGPTGVVAMNGEQFGGLVKVQELRADLAKVNAFLAALRTSFNSVIPSPGDGGGAIKAAVVSALNAVELPNYQTIESQMTRHGGA